MSWQGGWGGVAVGQYHKGDGISYQPAAKDWLKRPSLWRNETLEFQTRKDR